MNSSRKPKPLSFHQGQNLSIPPKETVVYTKQTQTTSSGGHDRDSKFLNPVHFLETFDACGVLGFVVANYFNFLPLLTVINCVGFLNHSQLLHLST